MLKKALDYGCCWPKQYLATPKKNKQRYAPGKWVAMRQFLPQK